MSIDLLLAYSTRFLRKKQGEEGRKESPYAEKSGGIASLPTDSKMRKGRKLLESFRIVRKLEIQYNKFICFLIKQI
ncbi:MAG: hypothetical protein HFE96_02250 [Acutalibacter sp.]|jgi:hypothetical protein|nr:hypothetical protein [Acutalibacter sp.]